MGIRDRCAGTRRSVDSEWSESQLAEARGALASARARLAGLLGLPVESLRVAPALEVMPHRDETVVGRDATTRPGAEQARASLRFAQEAERRARWAWLPTLELGAGVKRADNAGANSGRGYALGVSLSIPLFDHGQGVRLQARAQHALASARSEALARSNDSEVERALLVFRAARDELARFEARALEQVQALLLAARSGYREGERTVVELLDAQRAQTDVAERRLNLLRAAKRAEARLRAAAGDLQ